MSIIAISCFALVIIITLVITYFAARRTRTAADFYVAGGQISGVQNGLAIAGDFMSAATLLGTTAMIFVSGFDAAIYLCAAPMAFVLFLFLMTDKLRALGRFTFVDILVTRLDEKPIRLLASGGSFLPTAGWGHMSSSMTAIRVRMSLFVTLKTM